MIAIRGSHDHELGVQVDASRSGLALLCGIGAPANGVAAV